MTEEETYDEVNMSDIIDETEQYVDTVENTETDLATNTDPDTEIFNSDNQVEVHKPAATSKSEVIRSTRLPMARIKNIMKMDPDVNLVSGEAVFLVTKATELFLETLAKETHVYTAANKRKTIAKKDLDLVINKVDCLCFLEGAMDF